MEQLQAFDEGICGTSDLTDVLGGVLGRSVVWTPISAPPDMTSQEYGWPMSEPVLGVTKRGRMQVVTYEQVDEDCEPTWKTACSERWDVSGELTHWMNLPQPPNVELSGPQAGLSPEGRARTQGYASAVITEEGK